MASTSSTIRIIIDGATRGVEAAAARARTALSSIRDKVEESEKSMERLGSGFGTLSRSLAALGALGSSVQIIAGTTAALQQLLPIVLLAPAAIGVLGAAFATFKIATSGFGDAVKSGDLSKLSPQARAAAVEVRALGKAFGPVKQAVQDKFFAGFAADIKQIGSAYLPVLASKLPQIAAGFNALGRSIAFALTRPATSFNIGIVLANTAKLLQNARNSAGAFISGFAGLAAIGSTYLPRLGIAIDGVAQRFERFVARAGADGTIRRLIDDALQGFRDLFAIIGNVGAALGLLFGGLSVSSASPLANLRDLTQAVRDFLAEVGTQTALKAFGEALATISGVVRDVLLAALRELAPIVADLAPVFAEIAQAIGDTLVNAIGIVGPLITGLSGFLKDHKEIIGIVAQALLLLYGRFLLLKGVAVVGTAIGKVVTALGGLAGVLRLIPLVALAAIAVELDKINVAAAGGDPEKLQGTADQLHNIVEAGKALLALDFSGIGADIQEELGQIGDGFKNGTSPIGSFVKTITERVQEFGRVTGESFRQIGGFFETLGQRASDFATKTGESVGKIGTFFSELPGKIGEALATAGAALLDAGTRLVQPIVDGVRTKFEEVKAFFSQSPYEIGFAIGSTIGTLLTKGGELVEQLRLGAVQKFEEVRTFFAEAPGKIGEALASLGETLRTKAVEGGQAFLDGMRQKFDEARTFITEAPGKIGEALASLGETLRTKAVEGGQAFLDGMRQKFDEVVAFIVGIPARIFGGVEPVKPGLSTRGTEAGQGFLTSISKKLDEAVAFVAGIPGKILGALGNAGSLLVAQGKAIIDGLLAGIKQGYNAMIQFVSGIAAGIAANKGPLPYDRKVLVPAGLALMEGLRAGLERGNADVQAFVGTIAGGLAGTLDAGGLIRSATAASAAFGTSAPTSRPQDEVPSLLRALLDAQNADVRVFIGDRELRDIVRTEVGGRDRATVRTVTTGSRAV